MRPPHDLSSTCEHYRSGTPGGEWPERLLGKWFEGSISLPCSRGINELRTESVAARRVFFCVLPASPVFWLVVNRPAKSCQPLSLYYCGQRRAYGSDPFRLYDKQ